MMSSSDPMSAAERDRLIQLIREHRLAPIEAELLAHSAPCITLVLKDIENNRGGITDPPSGSSYMGGRPDVPQGFAWPVMRPQPDGEEVHAGFLMQIDLAELPQLPGNPLPEAGLLSVYHWDQCVDFAQSFEVRYFAPTGAPWQRIGPPKDMPCASEVGLCLNEGSFPIEGVIGIDAPSKGQHDLLSRDAFERFQDEPDDTEAPDWWAYRWATFRQRAADPGFEARSAQGFRYDWWLVGQLLGRMDEASAEWCVGQEGDAPARRLLLQIETNPVVDFAGGCDAAPVLVLARDDGTRPLTAFDNLRVTFAP